jgi:hypothetical protein
MPIARVKFPDGRIGRFNMPEGATPDDAISFAEQQGITKPATELPTTQAPQDSTLAGRLGERVEKFTEYAGKKGDLGKAAFDAPTTAVVAAGQIAGGLGDVVATGLTEVYKTITPESVQNKIKETAGALLETKAGKLGMSALEQGGEIYGAYKDAYPEQAMELESAVNLAMFGGGAKATKETGKVVKAAAKEGIDVASDAARLVTGEAMPRVLDTQLKKVVEDNVWKMIRPSVFKKKTPSHMKGYLDDVKEAVVTITKNKKNLGLVDEYGKAVEKLPENLWELSTAIDNTKKQIFTAYDDMARAAGDAPVNVDDIVAELRDYAASPKVQAIRRSAANKADELADFLEKTPQTASDIQELIKDINVELQPFYRNPTPGEAKISAVYETLNNKLRSRIDDHIASSQGEGYRNLKRQYKALKSIEDEVGHRAIINARANQKRLMDFTDIYTGAQVMETLVAGGAAPAAKGAAVFTLKGIYKNLNDPNRFVKNMFKKTDKIVEKMEGFKPKSKTGKAIKGKIKTEGDRMVAAPIPVEKQER